MTASIMAKTLVLGTMLVEVDLVIKSFFELIKIGRTGLRIRHYWYARILYPFLLSVPVFMVFKANKPLLGLVAVAAALAFSDRILWWLQQGIHSWWGVRLRVLQVGQQMLLVGLAIWAGKRLSLHPTALARTMWAGVSILPAVAKAGMHKTVAHVAGIIWVVEPTNFLIRWLLNKDDDQFLVEVPCRALRGRAATAQAEQAATAGQEHDVISPDTLRAGRVIGALERLTLLILTLKDEYGALGLVLAAKSMARFTGIQDKMMTAEYYLMGTLLSTFSAIVVGLLLSTL